MKTTWASLIIVVVIIIANFLVGLSTAAPVATANIHGSVASDTVIHSAAVTPHKREDVPGELPGVLPGVLELTFDVTTVTASATSTPTTAAQPITTVHDGAVTVIVENGDPIATISGSGLGAFVPTPTAESEMTSTSTSTSTSATSAPTTTSTYA